MPCDDDARSTHTLRLRTTRGYARFVPRVAADWVQAACKGATSLVFVGWSLGGVGATFGAVGWVNEQERCGGGDHRPVSLVTFGSPRFLHYETVEGVLNTHRAFHSLTKHRFCAPNDWACTVYPSGWLTNDPSSTNDFPWVHWGSLVGSNRWNAPVVTVFDGTYATTLLSLVSLLGRYGRDAPDLDGVAVVRNHAGYATLFGAKECPDTCGAARRDPACWQAHVPYWMTQLCDVRLRTLPTLFVGQSVARTPSRRRV